MSTAPLQPQGAPADRARRTALRWSLAACCAAAACAAQAVIQLPSQPASAPQAGGAGRAPQAQGSSLRLPSANTEQVLNSLIEAANAGDADAMVQVGMYYHTNPGLPQAAATARRWWIRAAQSGDVRGMAGYGYLLGVDNAGGQRDLSAAREWLHKARAAGLVRATYIESLLEGQITGPKKLRDARRLLEQAAQDGDALAMNDLAVAWELDGSLERAREMYVLAAAQGYGVARANYLRLERQNRSSESATLARLRTLSDDGNADATLQLAQLYHQGRGGVQRDFAQAIQLYRRAADGGSRSAREFLALVFSRSSRDNSARGVDAAWMEELATRINARTDGAGGTEGRDLMSDRPRRSEDPLWNLTSLRWTPPVTDEGATPP
ncbi:MAG: tetratricopeptide repeat protein [Pseudomonadota bacterium]